MDARTPGWYAMAGDSGSEAYWDGQTWADFRQPMPQTPVSKSAARAGWYADPTMAATQRYWDGAAWTDHRAPMVPQPAPVPAHAESQPVSEGVLCFGMLTAIFIPIVGFIIGLSQINKRGNDGLVIIVTSVFAFIVWFALLTN